MPMTYEEFMKTAVTTSDLRTIESLDPGVFSFNLEPVPGIAFMQIETKFERGETIFSGSNCLGYITYDPNRKLWDVIIENTEQEFVTWEQAARHLWDNWCKSLYGETKYRLIRFSREGDIESNEICDSEDMMLELAVNYAARSADEYEACQEALSRVGARYYEYMGGHLVALPLED